MNRHLALQPKLAYVNDDGILVVKHSSGFFSCCTIRLRKIINYYNEYKHLPVVDSSEQWHMYKDTVGDITHRLFTAIDNNYEFSNPVVFSYDTCEDQFSDFALINYSDVNLFVKKYFTVSSEIDGIKAQLLFKYGIDTTKTIAVCYRGCDKRTESNVPLHATVIDNIQSLQAQYPVYDLLIQSDEIEFYESLDAASIKYIQFTETPKVHADQRASQFYIPYGMRLSTAQTFLAVMQILSSCDILMTNSGNVGMWLHLFRGHANNTIQLNK